MRLPHDFNLMSACANEIERAFERDCMVSGAEKERRVESPRFIQDNLDVFQFECVI